MEKIVGNLMRAALMECSTPLVVDRIVTAPVFEETKQRCEEDLQAFASKDPAAHGRAMDIAFSYSSFKAVLHYRLSHMLLQQCASEGDSERTLESTALLVSSRGKLMSGAEIHPSCKIGRRFILDHGQGTVIGETVEIGDDCYILGGVVLGATGISANPSGKRHPTIGNHVQIGAFARVLGDIAIGDDVFVGPHCVIKEDIPAGSIVTLRSELQIVRGRHVDHQLQPVATQFNTRPMEAS
ncbi:serine O-acetyltransferase [Bordetella genomosp. 1]|uniref:serine O-acetyltransferase n=1 Tax=Bordetella genomosp. 1 TaxID=1395607 RepID=A0ABX4EZV8_9BORD|nr:serine O-acetyltransferase [Bordetella genomosp. 1]OZI65287.1 serine acetyltransferase [Bordetella genomosp. 1]